MIYARPIIASFFWFAALVACNAAHDCRAEEQAEIAREFRDFLQDLLRVDQLLDDLGAADFATREAATRRLMQLPVQPTARLQTLAGSDDPEKRYRARHVLRKGASDWKRVEKLVGQVRNERVSGLTAEILTLLELCDDEKLSWSLQQALLATASDSDVETLRQALKKPVPTVRVAAVVTLTQLGTQEAVNLLLVHQKETEGKVLLSLGEGLIKLGRREGLPILIGLLSSGDGPTRTRAAVVLQSATGRNEGFLAAKDDEGRAGVIQRWRRWLASEGKQAKLRPIEATITAASPFD